MTDRERDIMGKETYALWLPKASVRAILAFTVLGMTGYALFNFGIEVAAPLLGLSGVVVEKYFSKDVG